VPSSRAAILTPSPGFDERPQSVSSVLFVHAISSTRLSSPSEPRPLARTSFAGLSSRRATKTVWRRSPLSLGEVHAQPRHSVVELAHVHVDERARFCSSQVFLAAPHFAIFRAPPAGPPDYSPARVPLDGLARTFSEQMKRVCIQRDTRAGGSSFARRRSTRLAIHPLGAALSFKAGDPVDAALQGALLAAIP
jgi:hypothetical protein